MPTSDNPSTGSHIAYNALLARWFMPGSLPVVFTVSVDVPAPPVTAVGIEQVGNGVPPVTLATEQVKFTVPAYPLIAAIVIVEVEEPP